MVRVAGVDVPDGKRVDTALRRIYGIGPMAAQEILRKADIDGDPKPKVMELSDAQVDRLREIIDREYKVEGDLRREVTMNIRRLIEIGSFRGSATSPRAASPGPEDAYQCQDPQGAQADSSGTGTPHGSKEVKELYA